MALFYWGVFFTRQWLHMSIWSLNQDRTLQVHVTSKKHILILHKKILEWFQLGLLHTLSSCQTSCADSHAVFLGDLSCSFYRCTIAIPSQPSDNPTTAPCLLLLSLVWGEHLPCQQAFPLLHGWCCDNKHFPYCRVHPNTSYITDPVFCQATTPMLYHS